MMGLGNQVKKHVNTLNSKENTPDSHIYINWRIASACRKILVPQWSQIAVARKRIRLFLPSIREGTTTGVIE